jgi:hypothetical protein
MLSQWASHLVHFGAEFVDGPLELLVLLREVLDGDVHHVEDLHPGVLGARLLRALDGGAVVDVDVLVHGHQHLLKNPRKVLQIFTP